MRAPLPLKEMDQKGLEAWLLLGGYAEAERGFGHVTAEDLAAALLENYEIRLRSVHS